MAQSNPPLLERDALASLNQLRDGPAAVRLASHLLTTLAGGLVWAHQPWPLALKLPVNLGEALDAFKADSALRRRQWQRERGDISDTERRACLDC
jgi:hypothetical protein